MIIGVPKEIKNNEFRVGLIPSSVRELVAHGHRVLVETQAAAGIGLDDTDYQQAGATLVDSAAEIFARAELIVKVKEPQPHEIALLRPNQVLFTYLHLAADPQQTQALLDSQAICIAYETVEDPHGRLPLLAPMSEVAGKLAVQAGAHFLQKSQGGRGILLGGAAGVASGKVVIIGAGTVGRHAALMAVGLQADTVVLDTNLNALHALEAQFGNRLQTLYSNRDNLEQQLLQADLVIGAALIPGASAPKLITAEHIRHMKTGAVIVDVAIDQGGCAETSRPTSHAEPTYTVDGVIHYCVSNMPGAVPHTSAYALNHATLPYILALADKGYQKALLEDPHFRKGLNVCCGQLTHPGVAQSLGLDSINPEIVLA
ncbi:alanine dehydrogenase [Thiomicrorhabdus cannonii]|uniref:alanine dehydrogenase n=1 Tax=Thiomicrorhabdus cannonii TaxID=2748011 RepID=UPI0015C12A32